MFLILKTSYAYLVLWLQKICYYLKPVEKLRNFQCKSKNLAYIFLDLFSTFPYGTLDSAFNNYLRNKAIEMK